MLFAWISVIWIAFIYRAGQCVRRNNYFSYVKLGFASVMPAVASALMYIWLVQ